MKKEKTRYYLITYGCQANISDSERIEQMLDSAGYLESSRKEEADLVIINCCSVRQSAVDRAYGQASKIKKDFGSRIIFTGCLLEKEKEKVERIGEFIAINDLINQLSKKEVNDYFQIEPKYKSNLSALVPIMTGCDNFCSYCAVPFTRGREKSRKFNEVINEVKKIVADGYKEIWLLGQNVNSYKDGSKNFHDLLKEIDAINGDFWIRFTSSHPKDFTKEIIDAMKSSPKITNYLNLPVQSGDNQVLERMNRPYTISEYKKCISLIRKEIPDITLSTDLIVGFPGETEKEFQNSKKLLEEINFDMAYISRYSPRPGTKASKLDDDVSFQEKKRREEILNETLKKGALKINKRFIGKTLDLLIFNEKKGYLLGKSKEYKSVKVKKEVTPLNDFIKAKINKASSWGLEGEIIQK